MLTRYRASKRKSVDADLVEGPNEDSGAKFSNNSQVIKTWQLLEDASPKLQKRSYGNLPAEVLLTIFKHLDSNVIASSVLLVCKTWYDVGRSPILWKDLTISVMRRPFSNSLENNVISVLQRTNLLRSLTLNIAGEISSILECVAKSCSLINYLALSHCRIDTEQAVQSVVSSLSLKYLCLDYSSGSALKNFAELKTLVELQVDRCQEFRLDVRLFGTYIDPAHHFLDRLSKNSRQLETVKLNSSPMCSDEQVLPLLTNLRSVLKEVCLWAPQCRRQTFRAVAKCENLQSMKFNIPGSHLDSDFNAMKILKRLKKMYIKEIDDLSSYDWEWFVLKGYSEKIEYVCFDEFDNVDRILYEALFTRDDTILHGAKTVDLSYCRISDHILKVILTADDNLGECVEPI